MCRNLRSWFSCTAFWGLCLVMTLQNASHGQSPNRPKVADRTAPATLKSLAWLSGTWSGEDQNGQTEEFWMAPRGGMMPGVNRAVYNSGKTTFEFLRITDGPGGLTYYASPGGQTATPFRLKESADYYVVFENSENDFPQRIIYRRMDDTLHARIEGTVNGQSKSMEWKWKHVTPESQPQ